MKTRILLLAVMLCGVAAAASAQRFDDYFEDRTLRLDYILAGNSTTQAIYFEQAFVTPRWAGRKSRLSEVFLRGNGQIALRHPDTHELLYVNTFSTLFQEWLAEEEATRISKAFELSCNVPFPKQPVEVVVSLSDFRGRVMAELVHTVNPDDILIRRIGENGIPSHYVWMGQTTDGRLQAAEADITACIDLAIVAEGYSVEQMGKFRSDCQRVVDALFAHEPFASLKERFNVVAVESPSLDSGPSVPRLGRWSRTPAGTHYDTFYTDRYLMTQHMHRIYDLLSGVHFEHIIVLVNSATYGGGGIYNQLTVTTSDHSTFKPVLVHEFGHGYAGLGDEYFYDDQFQSMYPADAEPWEPNLTTLSDFGSKWADMVPKGTAIPTHPEPIPDYRHITTDLERRQLDAATQRVGVFEGGGYQSKGVYRPSQECRMKINEVEHFCPVCTRAIIRITDFYTSH